MSSTEFPGTQVDPSEVDDGQSTNVDPSEVDDERQDAAASEEEAAE